MQLQTLCKNHEFCVTLPRMTRSWLTMHAPTFTQNGKEIQSIPKGAPIFHWVLPDPPVSQTHLDGSPKWITHMDSTDEIHTHWQYFNLKYFMSNKSVICSSKKVVCDEEDKTWKGFVLYASTFSCEVLVLKCKHLPLELHIVYFKA